MLYQFGKEGSHPFDFPKASLSVSPSQPSQYYAQQTQIPGSSLYEIRPKVF
jgi:hypothetical protein